MYCDRRPIEPKSRNEAKSVPIIFNFFGPDWHYKPHDASSGYEQYLGRKRTIPSEILELHSLNLLPYFKEHYSSNYLKGTYKNVALELNFCRLESTFHKFSSVLMNSALLLTRSEPVLDTRHTVFKGQIIKLNLPKKFSGITIIKRDQGVLGNTIMGAGEKTPTRIAMENPVFESLYEVFSTDEIEARYLINPAFMERLIELEGQLNEHFETKCEIQCAFKDSSLYLVIPASKPFFSGGSIFAPANFIDEINQILKEMDQLFAIIDVLKLDDRSGL